ncbi:MAG: hypothetical protein O2913_10395, partial [Chloroflexi bacterium]|nr:hypothetical protein [Chloroflexota bacterium]
MRVTMIHAIAESIPPVRLAFKEEFPEAEVINVLDESLLIDFNDRLTPNLRRRMTDLNRDSPDQTDFPRYSPLWDGANYSHAFQGCQMRPGSLKFPAFIGQP